MLQNKRHVRYRFEQCTIAAFLSRLQVKPAPLGVIGELRVLHRLQCLWVCHDDVGYLDMIIGAPNEVLALELRCNDGLVVQTHGNVSFWLKRNPFDAHTSSRGIAA